MAITLQHLPSGIRFLILKSIIMKNRPLILVVNDDGLDSPGIKVLGNIMREIGDVVVVAPSLNRSGLSHAMTLDKDIYIQSVNANHNEYMCSGTPVDCVKLAFNKILPRKPDLCVSGINHGSNHSVNSLYSGTLHGAMEGSIQGVPSISFSHLSYSHKTSLNNLKPIIQTICSQVLKHQIPNGVTLNINFPDINFKQIKGIRICKQAPGYWVEDFQITKKTKQKTYYRVTGQFNSVSKIKNTDSWLLANQYISILPISIYPDFSVDNQKFKYLENDF